MQLYCVTKFASFRRQAGLTTSSDANHNAWQQLLTQRLCPNIQAWAFPPPRRWRRLARRDVLSCPSSLARQDVESLPCHQEQDNRRVRHSLSTQPCSRNSLVDTVLSFLGVAQSSPAIRMAQLSAARRLVATRGSSPVKQLLTQPHHSCNLRARRGRGRAT